VTATEITWARRHRLHPTYIEELGGPGWSADAATVIGQIGAGREYFVQVEAARFSIVVSILDGRKHLCSDPDGCIENYLLSLPSAPA
jgi:hypothetical protein